MSGGMNLRGYDFNEIIARRIEAISASHAVLEREVGELRESACEGHAAAHAEKEVSRSLVEKITYCDTTLRNIALLNPCDFDYDVAKFAAAVRAELVTHAAAPDPRDATIARMRELLLESQESIGGDWRARRDAALSAEAREE